MEEVEEELEEDRRLPKGKQEEGAEGASWDYVVLRAF